MGKKLKAFLGGKDTSEVTAAAQAPKQKMTYSENSNLLTGPRRQYNRVTKKSLEEQANLEPDAGSLWVMEGQGAYLFSQNIMRMVGDPIAVKIDGEPKEQLQTKVSVIGKLLQRLEDRTKARYRNPASDPSQAAAPADEQSDPNSESETAAKNTTQAKNQSAKEETLQSDFNVKTVTTRVMERTVDGNYRVKGSQPFMIGSREYKVIVTGIIRAEDFSEDGISSTKLLDPSYDIVGVRRRE